MNFCVSSGHVNERLSSETAQQHRMTLTGMLQPCGECLEAKGVQAGVPRETISRAGKPVETVHIDLAGPYEASVGGSVDLIMFVGSPSRRVRPHGMRNILETVIIVRKFVADVNNMGWPHFLCTDNSGELTSRG